MSQGKRESKAQADPLEVFSEALRERVASREALLAEGKAMTARRRKAGKAAKASLLSLLVAGSLWWLDPAWHTEQVRVAVGAQRELVLADGSQVLLDSGSRLQIERHLRSRQLELLEGQARFTVVHADAPFIVHSQGVRVRDIGTVFDVRSDVRGVRVGVLEGAVEVGIGHGAVQPLRAGQQLLAAAGELGEVQAVASGAMEAWRSSLLRFDGTPLRDAIVDLQRYSEVPLRLADERTGGLRLSGEFDSRQVRALLEQLPAVLPVTVVRAADGGLVIGRVD
ncbi:FecR family protein [Pseudomonas putida]|uniref:FecR family protein n=1 Tax=Pseudomonas putida TaxID=303 RepID=UPI0015760503|nr:FecR domain-containing protein [Pseudomonas putida]NTY91466.1 iron dicitrate transport regulator FecR [Pseudomonas putida]NTZ01003.1 iron dicitrate transport regulator FecR [Pseudomonas putida]NTZ24227.1 iron dicitrate transport regulator FecR [Pseudomonas putida]NTZ53982.1 iron dicitrate transport regulator FecR [Pseudomonas putida]NTZ64687.1 iron dicitrate transport regulator FecR [Pseudomonas putida]